MVIVPDGDVGELVFHDCPEVLDGVQVRGVPRPVDQVDVVAPDPVHGHVAGVTGGSIL